ncbi:MAG: HlyD family type I secretion periplasmic adaptor subunit [Parvularculaceae bacterium]
MSSEHNTAAITHENVGERHGLALPIELEEGAPPFLSQATMAILSGLVILLLVWANIAHIRELSVAMGEISPTGSTRQAAHLEGGIVDEVLVAPGDAVTEGQPLVKLRTDSANGEYDRFEARSVNLKLRAERLAAEAAGREPDFSEFEKNWPVLVREQRDVFAATSVQYKSALTSLVSKEASAEAEVKKAEAEASAEADLLTFAREQLAIQDELIGEGFTSKQIYLQAKSGVATAEASSAAALVRRDQARRAYDAVRAEREGAEAEHLAKIGEERSAVLGELAELEKPIVALKNRSDRLTVRAPVAGVVNEVFVHGAGDVVRPGGVIAEITPSGAAFFAEVHVKPKDIGHIAVGQKTDVTVTTFDPNRYGKLSGTISHISADTFADERTGDHYYIAYVALGSQTIGKGKRARPLTPGMQVRAEIVTQSRTLMQYALKPVVRSLDQAFTER